MKILLVDQFTGLSPYWLQQNNPTFDELCEMALDPQNEKALNPYMGTKVQVLEVDEKYVQPMCTTTFREGVDGKAEVWRYRWDSSG